MVRSTSHTARRSLLIRGERTALLVPLVLFCLAYAATALLILLNNHGMFTYTLDDAYIHLALAENIAHGHYGINSNELSAPSSSMLWPFILAPVAGLPGGDLVPLLTNLFASLGVLVLAHKIISGAFAAVDQSHKYECIALVLILFAVLTNLLGVAFTGMEHSLQMLCAMAVVLGMITEHAHGRVPWWFACGLVLGPLIRYENLCLSVPALISLFGRKHTAVATLCSAVLGVALAGFSLFLFQAGLGFMPTSVLAKSHLGSDSNRIVQLVANAIANLKTREGVLLLVGLIIVLADRRPERRALVVWGAAATALHMVLGKFGWYGRYELYIWAVVLSLVIHAYGAAITRYSPRRLAVISALVLVTYGATYLSIIATTPTASSDIYRQQYQMHRFATEYYHGAMAVNDIGWVAYRNPAYVLDLIGLASREALHLRATATDNTWPDTLAREHGVHFAMIYDSWFDGVPPGWIAMGKLYLDHTPIMNADAAVTFYALDPATAAEVQPLLERFRSSLPPGARFVFSVPSR